jgi:hypothetical protein
MLAARPSSPKSGRQAIRYFHFQKNEHAHFDTLKNYPHLRATESGSFGWRDHQNFRTALFAPGNKAGLAATNRRSVSRFDGDGGGSFLATHWFKCLAAFPKFPNY